MTRRPALVVGVDPGTSVGVAALLGSERYGVWQYRMDAPDGREWLEDTLRWLAAFAAAEDVDLLAATERFIVNARTARLSQQTQALAVNGVVQATLPVEIELQSVATASTFAPNDRLRRLGLWTTAREVNAPDADDANSAMRHAVLLLARKQATWYADLVSRATSR